MLYDAAIALYWTYVLCLIGFLHLLGSSETPRFVRYRAKVMKSINPQWWHLPCVWALLGLVGWVYAKTGLYALTAMCFLEGFVWFVAFVYGLLSFRKMYEEDIKRQREERIASMKTDVDRGSLAVDTLLNGPPERLRC